MPSLQSQILELLHGAETRQMDVEALVRSIIERHTEVREAQVRAALFPLLSTAQVELSNDGIVKLAERQLVGSN